ncbi:uncharacterized protein A1O9_10927 [Exophiala aquamarina CBS 119918]|uniref:Uncharacterized protein n=1 Tax=Exophiala aquamarina CBS 119918 TaxID=1182545 RepID=A0A072NYR8_9EURO|nr:uncharacterized protein A1O9_10927 [Exophiala aquamarina CBS 119918]KEF53019.1 hypothetical protein A1O9_10927 [Exophiala aquamarina CBS 119918]
MAGLSYPDYNRKHCSSTSHETLLLLAVQQQCSQPAVVSANVVESTTGHIYQKHEISKLDKHSFHPQDLQNLSHRGDNPYIYGGISSNDIDVQYPHPHVQTAEDAPVGLCLNPEAPAFVSFSTKFGNKLNPQAPSFTPSCADSRNELNPEAATFIPSTNHRKRMDPEAAAFLPAGAILKDTCIHEPREDFDGEAR